jgi:hypothetical protein
MTHKVHTQVEKHYSQDPSPLAPSSPRPRLGCAPPSSSSDTHSVTLDMLTSVLLDYSFPLTPGTSDWAAMGGDLEVLNRLRRPLLPAGPHVQGGATARHAPPSRALLGPPPPPTTSRLIGTPRLCMVHRSHGRDCPSDAPPRSPSPPSSQSPAALSSSFTTPLSTTCGCASGQQRVPRRSKK